MDEQSAFVKNLYELYEGDEWRKVIKLADTASHEERRRYLWAWPTEQNMKELKSELDKIGVRSILSIGCGTGLFEWIMNKCTGIPIKGIEVDEFYWVSKNAPRPFVELEFARRQISSQFYSNNCSRLEKYGIMLCYFNNPRAFRDYVRYYIGNFIILIGPAVTAPQERHCDPMPECPDFENEKQWEKCYSKEWGLNKDICVIWKRKL